MLFADGSVRFAIDGEKEELFEDENLYERVSRLDTGEGVEKANFENLISRTYERKR